MIHKNQDQDDAEHNDNAGSTVGSFHKTDSTLS